MAFFRNELAFLSNFHPAKVTMYGKEYRTVEHAFQAAKTLNPVEREEIRQVFSPAIAKKLGRKVTLREDWNEFRLQAMEELVRRKFQEPTLARLLKETGSRELIEHNRWHDNFWGQCTCLRCEGNWNTMCARGPAKNHLGRILMKVRQELLEKGQ